MAQLDQDDHPPRSPRRRFYHGYLVVAACCAMSLTTAVTWNTAGIFIPFLVEEEGFLRGSIALYLTITSFVSSLFLPIAGRLMQTGNARVLLTVAALLNGGGVLAMSTIQSVWHFYVIAPFLGVGQAFFLYLATPTLIGRWFKVRTGTFVGLAMSFTAVGAIVFNPIAGWVIETWGWRQGYVVLGTILLVVVVPMIVLFVRSYPQEMGLRPLGEAETGSTVSATNAVVEAGATVSMAVRSLPFVFLVLGLFALSLFNDMNAYLPSYATSAGHGLAVVATVGSASMLGATVGKFGLGALSDLTVKGSILICGLSGIVGAVLILAYGPTHVPILFVGCFLYGLMYSAATVQAPVMVRSIFGNRQFAQIHSIVMTIYSLASALGQSLWGYIADSQGGSYTIVLYCIIGLAVVFLLGMFVAYQLRGRVRWVDATPPPEVGEPA